MNVHPRFCSLLIFPVGSGDITSNHSIVIFPPSSLVGDTLCNQYTINGDSIKEEDEVFVVSIIGLKSVDMINGRSEVSITIRNDGDSKKVFREIMLRQTHNYCFSSALQ